MLGECSSRSQALGVSQGHWFGSEPAAEGMSLDSAYPRAEVWAVPPVPLSLDRESSRQDLPGHLKTDLLLWMQLRGLTPDSPSSWSWGILGASLASVSLSAASCWDGAPLGTPPWKAPVVSEGWVLSLPYSQLGVSPLSWGVTGTD